MGLKKKKSRRGEKWYQLAKEQGYRSRAAFKLIQLNKKYDFLSSAKVLIDLCAAPGGWLQVASKYMPVSSLIIGVDLLPIKPIKNVTCLTEDITSAKCRTEIKKIIKDWKVDVVLHDGSPSMGTNWLQDAYSQAELVLVALKLASELLVAGGTFVTKVFRSADYNSLLWVFNQLFKKVEATKPVASRSVSAEIFVVCRGFLRPDKIDPKLLDPRYVFKELEVPVKLPDIFNQKLKKQRHREGYEEGNLLLFKKLSVKEFIEAADPIKFLTEYNALDFDAASADYANDPHTTDEIKSCCEDLKVLGKTEFKNLLKWRLKMREIKNLDPKEEEKEEEEEEEAEPTAEEQEEAIDDEIQSKLSYVNKREKKKAKKKALLMAKNLQRTKLNMQPDETFEAAEEGGLFSLNSIQGSEIPIEESADKVETAEDDDEDAVPAEEDEDKDADYDTLMEKYLDQMYEQYTTASRSNSKKASVGKKEKKDKFTDVALPVRKQVYVPDLGDLDDEGDVEEEGIEDEDEARETEEAAEEDGEGAVTLTKRAAQWFNKSIFQDIGSDEEENQEQVQQTEHDEDDDDDDQLEAADDVPAVQEEDEEEELYKKKPKRKSAGTGASEDDDFEVVPLEEVHSESESESDSDDEGDDIDAGKRIEMLALGTLMLSKKRKRELIDDSYNRFAFNDEGLPAWFKEEEEKHNKPLLPITKDLADKIRQRFVEINARPIKKIAEAKARKKMQAIKKLEKMKIRATSISASSDLSEKEKMKALEKLYKKGTMTKKRPASQYVVAKKGQKTAGGRGIKVVDPRLKKDKRSEKKSQKGKGKGGRGGKKGRR